MKYDYKLLTFVAVVAICCGWSAYLIVDAVADAMVTQAAMENGYQQVVEGGDLVWRKRPGENFIKTVKWLIEVAVEYF